MDLEPVHALPGQVQAGKVLRHLPSTRAPLATVTVSLDYRNAPENSLEADLAGTEYQRDKSAKIYEAIRDSLAEIDFYHSVTNLKLETRDGRLHVHVVEDANEVISYPPISMIQHMKCRRVKESEIHFDSHMSGFVYKVKVHGKLLIKKEIPGPDSVDEFLYEINALNQLYDAKHVIRFYGIVVDDREEHVTGLLISYAPRGALIDVIYDSNYSLPWPTREKWARQIVGGLSEIHEAGFVQGDFTLSNIVIDENDDAKIIDINRRGCPIGWEPPEATPLIESHQRISMYIGVKSDLYQLGMVLWALATQKDEPDTAGRPLVIEPEVKVPLWYRRVVDICLSTNPRDRVQAMQLLSWFPESEEGSQYGRPNGAPISLNGDAISRYDYTSPAGFPRIKTVHPSDWTCVGWGSHHPADEGLYFPSRGRSPPSPMPSNQGDYDPARFAHRMYTWSDSFNRAPTVPSVSDVLANDAKGKSVSRPQDSEDTLETYADGPYRSRRGTATVTSEDDQSFADRRRSFSGKERDDGKTGPVGYDDISPIPTSTWGPPAKWHFEQDTHDRGSGDRSQSRGHTGPDSQADSGKDFAEPASTPREREHGGYFTARGKERSVSRGRSGRSSNESASQRDAQRGSAITAATEQSTQTRGRSLPTNSHRGNNNNYDGDDSRTDQDGHARAQARGDGPDGGSRPPTPDAQAVARSSYERATDDLKGVGSALGPSGIGGIGGDGDEKRQREIVIDEDLGSSELDNGLREALAAADDSRR